MNLLVPYLGVIELCPYFLLIREISLMHEMSSKVRNVLKGIQNEKNVTSRYRYENMEFHGPSANCRNCYVWISRDDLLGHAELK